MKSFSFGPLAKNTLVTTAGIGLRTLLQIALFLGVARTLGADGYGKFISVLVITVWFMPLVGLGSISTMVREAGQHAEQFPQLYGRSLVLVTLSSIPMVILVVITAKLILPTESNIIIIISLSLSELFCVPLVETCSKAFQSQEKMMAMVMIASGLIAARLIGFIIFFTTSIKGGVYAWSVFYLGAGIVSAIISIFTTIIYLSPPEFKNIFSRKDSFSGISFATTGCLSRINAELDKYLLARFDSSNTVGNYSAAMRCIDIIMLPVIAILDSTLVNFYREGQKGIKELIIFAQKIIVIPLIFTLICGFLLPVISNWIPKILGSTFQESATVIDWLILLPTITVLRSFIIWVAYARKLESLVSKIYLFAISINFIVSINLVPQFSWRGSIIGVYTSEVFIITFLCFWILVSELNKNNPPTRHG